MRKILLNQHTPQCENRMNKKDKSPWDMLCSYSMSKHLFFYNGEFIYLEVPRCNIGYSSENEFITNLLNSSLENSDKRDIWEISMSNHLDKDFKDFRIRGIELKKWATEINFIYYDNANKEYCIAIKRPISECIKNNQQMIEDSLKMRDFLTSERCFELIKQLDDLIIHNKIVVSEKEIVKSIDEFTKKLTNKKIKL